MNAKTRRAKAAKSQEKTLTTDQWISIRRAFKGCCAYCGTGKYNLVKEHFVPLSKGGGLTMDNIVPSCGTCNSSKHNKNFFEWYYTFKHYSREREEKLLNHLKKMNKQMEKERINI